MNNQKNNLYWELNLPLQVWPIREDREDENSPIIDHDILNYMPRRSRCDTIKLSELLGEQTHEEFFETAALHFENLAKLMREVAADPSKHVYYHDTGMDK